MMIKVITLKKKIMQNIELCCYVYLLILHVYLNNPIHICM